MGSGCTKLVTKNCNDMRQIGKPIKVHKRKRQSIVKVSPLIQQIDVFDFNDQISDQALQIYSSFKGSKQRISEYFNSERQIQLYNYFRKHQKTVINFLAQNSINNKIRQEIWKVLLFNIDQYQAQLFDEIRQTEIDTSQKIMIQKDVRRTFPNHPFFSQDENIQKFQELLEIISKYSKQIGYTQGVNYLTGFILIIYEGNMHESFYIFHFLQIKNQILGLYDDDFPLSKYYMYVFDKMLQIYDEQIYDHIKQIEVPYECFIFQWFTTLFCYSFPFQFAIRVWDNIINQDLFYIIKISLAVIIQFRDKILDFDLQQFVQFFRELKDQSDLFDSLQDAFDVQINLDKQQLSKYAKEFIRLNKNYIKYIENYIITNY